MHHALAFSTYALCSQHQLASNTIIAMQSNKYKHTCMINKSSQVQPVKVLLSQWRGKVIISDLPPRLKLPQAHNSIQSTVKIP